MAKLSPKKKKYSVGYIHHACYTSCRSEHIDKWHTVSVTSAPVCVKKNTLELVFLHSSFDLLKKYAKTLTFKKVLSYSWGPINQSKSVSVWTCNVSFIISSSMLWKINTLRLKHWLKSLWPQVYQHIWIRDVIMNFCLRRRGTHTCTYSTSLQLKIHSLLKALCSLMPNYLEQGFESLTAVWIVMRGWCRPVQSSASANKWFTDVCRVPKGQTISDANA